MDKLSWCLIGTSYILTSVHNPERHSAHYQRRKVTTNSAISSAAIYDSDLPAWHAGIVVAQSLCSYDWSFCYMRITLGESLCISMWKYKSWLSNKDPTGSLWSYYLVFHKGTLVYVKTKHHRCSVCFCLAHFCPLPSAPMRSALLQYCNWDSLSNWRKLKMQSCACF